MGVELAGCCPPIIVPLAVVDPKFMAESLASEIVVLAAATGSGVGATAGIRGIAVLAAATSEALLLAFTRVVVLDIVVVVVVESIKVDVGSGRVEGVSEMRCIVVDGTVMLLEVSNPPPASRASIAATICSSIILSSRRNVSTWSFGIVIV